MDRCSPVDEAGSRRGPPSLRAAHRRRDDRLRDGARHAHAAHRRHAVRDRGHRRDQLRASACAKCCCGSGSIALRALSPRRPPPGDRRVGRRVRLPVLRGRSASSGARGSPSAAVRQRAVPDAGPPPAAGQDRLARAAARRFGRRPRGRSRPQIRELDAATAALARRRSAATAPRLLGDLRDRRRAPAPSRSNSCPALQWRDAARCLRPMQDLGAYLPYRRVSFGQETVELARRRRDAASPAMVSIKEYPARPRPACSTSCCACRSS